jgi:hypothetical protein
MSEKQECGNVPPTSPANSPELARRTSCHAYTPPLNLLGQEVRTFFNINCLYLTGSHTLWFKILLKLLKIIEDFSNCLCQLHVLAFKMSEFKTEKMLKYLFIEK